MVMALKLKPGPHLIAVRATTKVPSGNDAGIRYQGGNLVYVVVRCRSMVEALRRSAVLV